MQNRTAEIPITISTSPPPQSWLEEVEKLSADERIPADSDQINIFADREGDDGYTLGMPGQMWGAFARASGDLAIVALTMPGEWDPLTGADVVVPSGPGPVGPYRPFGQHPVGCIALYAQVPSVSGPGTPKLMAVGVKFKGQV